MSSECVPRIVGEQKCPLARLLATGSKRLQFGLKKLAVGLFFG
jgi:hypothetical protein